MRVLVVTQLYAPENGALPNRMGPLVRHLAARGHEVFIATGMPNYPTGRVFPEYRGKLLRRESRDGATVLRTAYYTAPRNRSKLLQMTSYLSFLPAVVCSALRAGRPDVILVTSPPLFPVLVGMALAAAWRTKLVLDLRDLWPDEIVACGGAEAGSAAVRLLGALERQAYRRADRICCTTTSFMETVIDRGTPRERITLLPNGADVEFFRPLPRDNAVAQTLGLGDRFAVIYSGVLGIKHGLESLLKAAERLHDYKEIVFVIVGGGARSEALVKSALQMKLHNVIFLGERPANDIPAILSRADVCLSSLLPRPYLEKIISVKVFEYMACERPVIAAQSGETARVVQAANAGVVVPPADSEAIARAILTLYRDAKLRAEMGKSGRRYVVQNYSRAALACRLEQVLEGLWRKDVVSPELVPSQADPVVSIAAGGKNTSNADILNVA